MATVGREGHVEHAPTDVPRVNPLHKTELPAGCVVQPDHRILTCGHENIAVRGEAAAEQLGAVPCDLSLAVGQDLAVDGALVRMGKVAAVAAKVSGLQGYQMLGLCWHCIRKSPLHYRGFSSLHSMQWFCPVVSQLSNIGRIYYLATGDHPVDFGRRGILVPVEQVQVLLREVSVV